MKNITLTVFVTLTCSVAFAQNGHVDMIKEKTFKNSAFLMIYDGGYHVKPTKIVSSDLIVTNGDLTIDGTFQGRAVIDQGDLIVNASGQITGHITLIDGRVILQGAEIDPEVVEQTTWSSYSADEEDTKSDQETMTVVVPDLPELPKVDDGDNDVRFDRFKKDLDDSRRDKDAVYDDSRTWSGKADEEESDDVVVEIGEDEWDLRPWHNWNVRYPGHRDYRLTDYDNGYLAFDYNRVDGLFLGVKIDRRNDRFRFKPMRLYGQVGYAFSEKDLRYQVGLDRRWGRSFRFEVGGEVHDLTGSQDTWIVGHLENAFSALLFKKDYRDYFRTRGYSFHASQNLNPYLKITGSFIQDDYSSLDNEVNWSIFLPKQDFRANPAIDEGRLTGVSLSAELDNVKYLRYGRRNFRREGWHVVADAEKGVPSWDSDFRYARYTLQVVRYQPLSRWENLDLRLWMGTATGDLPAQKSFYAGGISTMRGHEYKEFNGNNVALLNVEYRISPNRFDRDRVLFLHPMNFILFMDNGYAWSSEIHSYKHLYRGFDMSDVETDIGVGLGDEKDIVRLDIAKNVSRKGSDYKMMLRINYAF